MNAAARMALEAAALLAMSALAGVAFALTHQLAVALPTIVLIPVALVQGCRAGAEWLRGAR